MVGVWLRRLAGCNSGAGRSGRTQHPTVKPTSPPALDVRGRENRAKPRALRRGTVADRKRRGVRTVCFGRARTVRRLRRANQCGRRPSASRSRRSCRRRTGRCKFSCRHSSRSDHSTTDAATQSPPTGRFRSFGAADRSRSAEKRCFGQFRGTRGLPGCVAKSAVWELSGSLVRPSVVVLRRVARRGAMAVAAYPSPSPASAG